MRKTALLVSGTLAVAALLGCGGNGARENAPPAKEPAPAEATAPDETAAAQDAAEPMQVGDYQVVRVTVRNTGYEPQVIRLAAGKPAKIVFVQEATSHCASRIQIPAMGVPVTDLPQGQETVVEFTPKEAGTYAFMCGMDMLRGTLEVTT